MTRELKTEFVNHRSKAWEIGRNNFTLIFIFLLFEFFNISMYPLHTYVSTVFSMQVRQNGSFCTLKNLSEDEDLTNDHKVARGP
jgi:hypothetical protein